MGYDAEPRGRLSEMNAATVFERAQDGDEQSLDMAFQAVEIASRFYSTRVANAVAERWLWGAGWKSVAHMLGCTRQSAFVKCLALFDWLDRNVVIEDGAARYVGIK